MAKKKLPASTGYFNKEMLEILEKGESKTNSKKATAKKPAVNNAAPAKKAVTKTNAAKKAAPAKKVAAKKPAAKKVKKLGKVIFEIEGQQIDYKKIEKKAAKLGGDVYVVVAEKKIFDTDGKSVDLF